MARVMTMDLCGEQDVFVAARQDRSEEIFNGLLFPADAQVEVAYGDSTIVMPLSIKAMWDEWIGR